MIDSIFVALSGMQGHERGLNVISNNVANMNTPGFRGSTASFADVFTSAPHSGLAGQQGPGGGLSTPLTLLDRRAGEPQQTGNDLDLRLDRAGFFIVQDESGEIRYTRNGSFDFNADGELVVRGQQLKVVTRNATGQLVPVEIKSLQQNPPKATGEVTFDKSLSSGDSEHTISSLVVHDKQGGKHTLKVEFRKQPPPTAPNSNVTEWEVTVSEDTTKIGSGKLRFISGVLEPGSSPLRLLLALQNTEPTDVSFNFDAVTGGNTGIDSSIAVQNQNGYARGEISLKTVDPLGVVKLTYSNGQKADGPRLTLAVIANEGELVQRGSSLFEYQGTQPVVLRVAGDDLRVLSQSLERSNVDLTEEFSELILMQRGYQASSQVVSTANDMLQELLQMKGGR